MAGLLISAPAFAQSADCQADAELTYICGVQKPEDLLALPGTSLLVASGFANGAGLKLVDTHARTLRQWYTAEQSQIGPDASAFPDCPGPPDVALFNTRGLSLRPIAADRYRLLVVNHGGRESVEAFDVFMAQGDAPRLLWRGCAIMPQGQVGNSAAQFADGTMLVTVLTRPGTTIGDFMLGQRTGAVWQRRPTDRHFQLLPGTDLPGNNGIETDPGQRRFYVVAFGWHAVVVFDRTDTRRPLARIEAPDFMPDNIHWTGGRLLLAGMRLDEPACGGLRKVINGQADPMRCPRGWVVGELDRDAGRIATFAYGTPRSHFNGLSAAALVGADLWLGSFQADRLASNAHD
ncbi:MAG: hypothetical protein NTX28_03985 [Novosphingobium sp.]|nr:hypothetical protein [Novosphingobium sp.]